MEGATYSATGTPGSGVELNTSVRVGSPVQLATSFAPGTVISSRQPLTVKWTGGEPGTLVKLTLTSGGQSARSTYTYAEAPAGSLTISPVCTGSPVSCSFRVPLSSDAQVTVGVMPAPDRVTMVTVPGVTGPVRLNWQYSYGFSGIRLQ